MSEYCVIKLEPCPTCGGTGQLAAGCWAKYQELIGGGSDHQTAAVMAYRELMPSIAEAIADEFQTAEQLQELSQSPCQVCHGSRYEESRASLSEALDALGR
ncbi:hypothetical protein [uncultured Thiodictyon sp.]|uniref:hypothetical protein n=1 Tax=uncultured Thiodictyon sp. TaxID=1846217 RepID=UPI0025E9D817|nr:hypothetical protein [uncultured Thiodictyon sp.]